MRIVFDDKAKLALEKLVKGSSEDNLRISVARGCGRPAYDIFPSFKGEDDECVVVDGISFVYKKVDENFINGIEIKYDKEVYNKGFWIK